MKSKNATLPVEALRPGDKFTFLSQPSVDAEAAVTMIVTRAPVVNLAANSCHFRYQPQAASGASVAPNGWQENQSWNGAPGVLVRLIDRAPFAATAEIPLAPDAAPRRGS